MYNLINRFGIKEFYRSFERQESRDRGDSRCHREMAKMKRGYQKGTHGKAGGWRFLQRRSRSARCLSNKLASEILIYDE